MAGSCRSWTRLCRASCEDLADRGLLDSTIVWCMRRVRPHAQGPLGSAVERRPQSLGHVFSALSPGRFQGRARGRRVRRPRASGSKTARSIRGTCIGSMYELLGIDPTGACRTRGTGRYPADDGVASSDEINHVEQAIRRWEIWE